MVEQPGSKSTPIRCVFNSSQRYKGFSLNTSWHKGPDMMNSMIGILLKFREAPVACQGDIKKMFYCVRVSKGDQMMQIFAMQFKGEYKSDISA